MTYSSHTRRTPRRSAPQSSAEEEAALARQWRDGKDRGALNRLVGTHGPFVISIARRLRGYPVYQDDLVSEGTLGLIRARHILVSRRIRDEPLRTRGLAARYRLSTERISQLEARAFEKVKNAVLARVGTR